LRALAPEAKNYYMGLAQADYENQSKTILNDSWSNLSNGLMSTNDDPKAIKNVMVDAIKYNRMASQLGQPTLDLKELRTIADNDAMEFGEIKTADANGITQIQPIVKRKDGRPMTDDKGNMIPYKMIGTAYKEGISEAAKEQLDLTKRGQDLNYSLAMSRGTSGGGRGGGSGGNIDTTGLSKEERATLVRTQATINAFNSRWKDPYTGELREGYQNDPLYGSYQSALSMENQIFGVGKGQSQGQQDSDYYGAMEKIGHLLNGKFSKDQIIAGIRQDYGYGPFADKLIEDTDFSVLDKKQNYSYGNAVYPTDKTSYWL